MAKWEERLSKVANVVFAVPRTINSFLHACGSLINSLRLLDIYIITMQVIFSIGCLWSALFLVDFID